jgi:hypothetical protein
VAAALLLVAFMDGMGVLGVVVFMEALSSPSFVVIAGILKNIWLQLNLNKILEETPLVKFRLKLYA